MSTLHTRFVVGATSVRFQVRADSRTGGYPDWQFSIGRRTRKIPGGNRSVTWFDGWGLSEVTMSLRFDSQADYRQLLALTGLTGELHLLAGFTSHEGDRYHHPVDTCDYERYADTTLVEAPQNVQIRRGGIVMCELTFARAWAPGTDEET